MNGKDFVQILNKAFVPFLKELGFVMEEPAISGRFYRVDFTGSEYVVSVSYEPGDEALFVMVPNRRHRRLSDIDDPVETPRLADLNRRFMSSVTTEERNENENYFRFIDVDDKEGRSLLKAATDLRLVLPKYLATAKPIEISQM